MDGEEESVSVSVKVKVWLPKEGIKNQATAAIDWLAAPESRCTSRDRAST